jgi:xylose isomerase
MIIWPGIEGYNYPFQSDYTEQWELFLDGIGDAVAYAAEKGVTVFLEHKNSEPQMKIYMRDIGMTMFVIHALATRGIDTSRTKVNMDWQHLIMNGENLAEYAELLAMQGLLGHQHANSGWGQFDDDNIVGATRFMETLELARALRKVGYGSHGERLGMDLYPYTEDAVVAARQSLLQWRFIDEIAGRVDDDAMRDAQRQKDALAAYRAVFQALGMSADTVQAAFPPHAMSGTL